MQDVSFSIIGAGGHAKVIIEIIESFGGTISDIISNTEEGGTLMGYRISKGSPSDSRVIIAVGDNTVRKRISMEIDHTFGTAIHSRANVSPRANIEMGSVVMAGVTINADTRIGRHAIINTNASVDHDCTIGDYVHISPNAALAGGIVVEEGAHIGIGSSLIQNIRIGAWSVIGAGAVIISDVPPHSLMVGIPGKVIRSLK